MTHKWTHDIVLPIIAVCRLYAATYAANRKGGDSNHAYELNAESYCESESDYLLQPRLASSPIPPTWLRKSEFSIRES